LAVLVTVAMGIIAVSPVLLVILVLPLIDFLVYKLIKALKD
jgi:hypothetical protein